MNKVGLITGASGGIGSVVKDALQLAGYQVSLLDLDVTGKEAEAELVQCCDVTKPEQVKRAVSATIEKFGRIDVLFNSAGRSHLGTIENLTLEELDKVYEVNVKGTFIVSKAVLPIMKEQRAGYIINMGSLRALDFARGKAAYSISKSAVRAFSWTLIKEVEELGIKVTLISPGYVDTSIYSDKQLRPYVQTIPGDGLKEAPLTLPADIARTVLYLLDLSQGASVYEMNIGRLWGI